MDTAQANYNGKINRLSENPGNFKIEFSEGNEQPVPVFLSSYKNSRFFNLASKSHHRINDKLAVPIFIEGAF